MTDNITNEELAVLQKFLTPQELERVIGKFALMKHFFMGFFQNIDLTEILNQPTNEVYKRYHEYCIAKDSHPISNIEFSRQVRRHFDIEIVDKKIQGKKYRVFASPSPGKSSK